MSKRKRPGTPTARIRPGGKPGFRAPPSGPDGPLLRGRDGAGSRGHDGSDRRGRLLLYGTHPVRAAIGNPLRTLHRLSATESAAAALVEALPAPARARLEAIEFRVCDRAALDALVGEGAVHQGLVLDAAPLPRTDPATVFRPAADHDVGGPPRLLLALDQITDPQNVGAILRSAALFGAEAVLLTDRHAPPETGALAKAAAGALDLVPVVRIGNLARTLEDAKAAGYWCVGLDADGDAAIDAPPPARRLVLVLGAEGAGLRRLTRERCDMILSIPAPGAGPLLDSLNVSAAAAIALFQLSRALRT